ncbi:type II toxin-antitoxin system RelE family toxin [Spiribacter salinus]|uniref:type II toxin-antitoxin system RelE family toxin n=1 Tax=Spiribacter salinus TaxID=1335746 RepID=UPI001C96FDB7|nr:type II toxin-antitoxin system RelE/ParE family toxin [Spiribacter salinus]MBY5269432.1 addiction module toxin RelE [Spiribacter salinus]
MVWRIEYLRSVRKAVEKLDPAERRRIRTFLERRIATRDDPCDLARPVKGEAEALWCFRVGDYRIISEIRDDTLVVLVVRVGHRREVYR